MKRYLVILLAIPLNPGNFGYASTECVEIKKASCIEHLRYSDPIGKRYRTLTILNNGKTIRILRGEIDNGGTFEKTDPPELSPDGNFVLLNQIESGEVETSSGAVIHHEVAYCELVDLRSGCIIARETGEFCGGTFTRDGRWKSQLYPEFHLTAEIPRAKKYVEGMLKFADSPASSFDNLLICDPPDANNKKDYRTIIESNTFNFDNIQREFLRRNLNDN
jgi:hypothetical protein